MSRQLQPLSTPSKRMQHGFAARNGLFASILAQNKYKGIERVFERPYGGFLAAFGQGSGKTPEYRPDEIVKGLGTTWQIEGIVFLTELGNQLLREKTTGDLQGGNEPADYCQLVGLCAVNSIGCCMSQSCKMYIYIVNVSPVD